MGTQGDVATGTKQGVTLHVRTHHALLQGLLVLCYGGDTQLLCLAPVMYALNSLFLLYRFMSQMFIFSRPSIITDVSFQDFNVEDNS